MIPERATSGDGLLLNLEGASEDIFSAVRTLDSAATAAALCDPWLECIGFAVDVLGPEEGLNADDNAAIAEAL